MDGRDVALSRLVREMPRLTQVVPQMIPRNVQAEWEVRIVGCRPRDGLSLSGQVVRRKRVGSRCEASCWRQNGLGGLSDNLVCRRDSLDRLPACLYT
jgi:hypothetical protein